FCSVTFVPTGTTDASTSRARVTESLECIVYLVSLTLAAFDRLSTSACDKTWSYFLHKSSLSVVTGSCLPSTAATTACQGRIAHFTRAGNLCTPANTASLPTPPSLLPVVTISCTLSNRAFTSVFVLPFNVSVRIDADAFEMAQPEP